MTDAIWTGDETIDYLINSKAVSAEENEIKYQVQVEFPRHTEYQKYRLMCHIGKSSG